MRLSDLPNTGIFTTIKHMLFLAFDGSDKDCLFFLSGDNEPGVMKLTHDTMGFTWSFKIIEEWFIEVNITFPSQADNALSEKHTRPFGVFHFCELHSMVMKIKYAISKNQLRKHIYPKASVNGVKDESAR